MKTITASDLARFWSKVDQSGDCWEWTASLDTCGYGSFWHGLTINAHRFAFRVAYGDIPDGMQVDHICHNRSCVNPDHLRLATVKQNNENPAGLYKSNTSGVSGVTRNPMRSAWIANVSHYGKRYYVGQFADIEDARRAVVAKRLELFTHNELDRKAGRVIENAA